MVAALAAVGPFFFLGNASGHDFSFHISSWMDAARQWHEGVLYPRWAAWANYGFGEARFIFYPPASWMLGAGLGFILPWKAVPGAFAWLALTLAGASMFRLARDWMLTADATRAAILYAVNPYHLLLVYFRSDYAELLASALFPLVVLYAVRDDHSSAGVEQARSRAPRPKIAPLALVFATTWLTNAPAAVVVTYSLALLLVVLAVIRRSAETVLAGAAAMALGLLLAGFYIVPAAFEQGWVNIAEALSEGLRPEQNFLFTTINDPEHNLFNLLVSTIAIAETAITAFAAVASSKPGHKARHFWWVLLALGTASVALMFPVTSLAWRYLPKLRFVQFPWRWLVPLGVSFAYFVAAALQQTRARLARTLLMAATLVAIGAYLVNRAWWDTADAALMQAAIAQGKGYEGTDEYQSRGADHYDLPAAAPLVAVAPLHGAGNPTDQNRPARFQVERWEPEAKLFTVEVRQPVTVALRLLNYPAWQVEVNSKTVQAESQEDTGQMMVPVSAGHSRVRVRFTRTTDRTAGAVLTGIGAVVFLGLAFARRRPTLGGR